MHMSTIGRWSISQSNMFLYDHQSQQKISGSSRRPASPPCFGSHGSGGSIDVGEENAGSMAGNSAVVPPNIIVVLLPIGWVVHWCWGNSLKLVRFRPALRILESQGSNRQFSQVFQQWRWHFWCHPPHLPWPGRKSFGSMTRIKMERLVGRIWKRSWEARLEMIWPRYPKSEFSGEKNSELESWWTQSCPRFGFTLKGMLHLRCCFLLIAAEVFNCFWCEVPSNILRGYHNCMFFFLCHPFFRTFKVYNCFPIESCSSYCLGVFHLEVEAS